MLEVIDIWKNYDNKPLLMGVHFEVHPAETVCLLGPSGGGKSTLLRIIAGLETSEAGAIHWEGKDLRGIPAHQRNFGLMFQDYALFPHRSVAQNIAFGLRMKGQSNDQIEPQVHKLLQKVQLEDLANRRVTELSGGEQQRVALARSLAPNPQLLMLDEPLGALDHTLSEQLAAGLRQILRSTGTPAIYVTHDQSEAFTVADRILLMKDGKIIQSGAPQQVYRFPVSVWAARFLGQNNLVEGKVISVDPLLVETRLGTFSVEQHQPNQRSGAPVQLLIRSAEVSLSPHPEFPNRVQGNVKDAVFQGNDYRVDITCPDGSLLRFHLPETFLPGEQIVLYLKPSSFFCIPD